VRKKGSSKLYWTGSGDVLPEVLGKSINEVAEYNREMERRKTKK
jgi:hypothetical protein